MIQTSVIMNEEAWQTYKRYFRLSTNAHTPAQPPSYPVLVISEVKEEPDHLRPASASQYYAHHSFIAANDLKRLLDLLPGN